MKTTRAKIGNALFVGSSAIGFGIGSAGAVLKVLDLKNNKKQFDVKDGIECAAYGVLVGSNGYTLAKLATSKIKSMKANRAQKKADAAVERAVKTSSETDMTAPAGEKDPQ